MEKPMVGQPAPDIGLSSTSGKTFRLADARGKTLVLYFYPRDNTPGCTTEGEQFRDLYDEFKRSGCEIYGVSRDGVSSHERFKAKTEFPFELSSDTDETACQAFDAIKMKNMYGKQVRGVERSTFVIDARGIVKRVWRG